MRKIVAGINLIFTTSLLILGSSCSDSSDPVSASGKNNVNKISASIRGDGEKVSRIKLNVRSSKGEIRFIPNRPIAGKPLQLEAIAYEPYTDVQMVIFRKDHRHLEYYKDYVNYFPGKCGGYFAVCRFKNVAGPVNGKWTWTFELPKTVAGEHTFVFCKNNLRNCDDELFRSDITINNALKCDYCGMVWVHPRERAATIRIGSGSCNLDPGSLRLEVKTPCGTTEKAHYLRKDTRGCDNSSSGNTYQFYIQPKCYRAGTYCFYFYQNETLLFTKCQKF